jgi:5-(aminomethyl)-3-furanmethanol phosphate kinase
MAVVIKLGGSLASAGTLRSWLDIILQHGSGRAVIVPGGGIFADAVREAQQRFGFSDRAAHGMALLAMEQYGRMLQDLTPALRPCIDPPQIAAALEAGAIALWMPSVMVEAAPDIAAGWDVTSDSLAAWLAGKLSATRLVLVKSAPIPDALPAPAALAAAGFVDAAFPAFVREAGIAVSCCGPGQETRLAEQIELG